MRQAALCPVCGVYYLVSRWQCLGVIGASRERPARAVRWRLRKARRSSGSRGHFALRRLGGSGETCKAKGATIGDKKQKRDRRVFGEFPVR